MRILRFGVTGPQAQPVFAGIDEMAFADRVARAARGSVVRQADDLRPALAHPPVFGELAPGRPVDPTDPRAAGWTFVVAANDPSREAWVAALQRLALHRGMPDPGSPVVYPADTADIADWLQDEYLGDAQNVRPRYVLLAGDPEYLPFELQVYWAAVGASVGRVTFDRVEELQAYVDKVLRLERAEEPVPRPHAVVFAPDYGPRDPTYYSRRFMAQPIAELIAADPRFTVELVEHVQATKDRLLHELTTASPALVYTASHGFEVPRAAGLAEQKRLNGAIACARTGVVDDMVLRGEDVPADGPVAEGSLLFQFACWGYGTPRQSAFDHWVSRGAGDGVTADASFVAALPKRLLAHPRGPVAFVGHVDTAWLHGFDDPDSPQPELDDRYHPRLEPFRTAVDQALLRRYPTAYALAELADRTALLSVNLATYFNTMTRRGQELSALKPTEWRALADAFIQRNDSMFFLLLGDPAARVRVGTP